MKRILLVTIFDNPNFGTYLQALATGITMQKYGYKVDVLRYERPGRIYKRPIEYKFHFVNHLKNLKNELCRSKSYLQLKGCRKFIKKYLGITKLYYTYEEILQHPPKADIFLVGSDQVWNTIHNNGFDHTFYLDFVKNGGKKVSYASSIGMSYIPEEYKSDFQSSLSDFYSLSVREKSAVSLLSELGLCVEKVLDPTFLLTKDEWSKFATSYSHIRPYVLVYSVESEKQDLIISQTARKIADMLKGDVIEVNYIGPSKQIPNCDKHLYYATPDQFLSLMLGASYTVVSSFHGTAFSMNFNIPFITVSPERFSSRLDDLLIHTHTENRRISKYNESEIESMFIDSIDFDVVNKIIAKERNDSIVYIEKKIVND